MSWRDTVGTHKELLRSLDTTEALTREGCSHVPNGSPLAVEHHICAWILLTTPVAVSALPDALASRGGDSTQIGAAGHGTPPRNPRRIGTPTRTTCARRLGVDVEHHPVRRQAAPPKRLGGTGAPR